MRNSSPRSRRLISAMRVTSRFPSMIGASSAALRQMPGTNWLDVGLIRINHSGARMDGPTYEDTNHPDNVNEVVDHIHQLKKEGLGVIGMKLCGGGQFEHSHEDRAKAMKFTFQNAGVDCATVGFKNTREIDEAIGNMNLALA